MHQYEIIWTLNKNLITIFRSSSTGITIYIGLIIGPLNRIGFINVMFGPRSILGKFENNQLYYINFLSYLIDLDIRKIMNDLEVNICYPSLQDLQSHFAIFDCPRFNVSFTLFHLSKWAYHLIKSLYSHSIIKLILPPSQDK